MDCHYHGPMIYRWRFGVRAVAVLLAVVPVFARQSARTSSLIDSKVLLKKTFALVRKKKYEVQNVDSTVCLEHPKIAPYVKDMTAVISGILKISKRDVSVKATTTEGLGFTGREEGIAAYAVALVEENR